MYTAATPEQMNHNGSVLKESEVNTILTQKKDLKDVGGVFYGEVNENYALHSYWVAGEFPRRTSCEYLWPRTVLRERVLWAI